MRYGKWFIGLYTAALFLVVAFFGTREYAWDETVGITAEITVQGRTEILRCWESDWGDYFLFLPDYVDLSQVRLRTNTRRLVQVDDLPIEDGMTCENLRLEEQYDLCFNGNRHFNLTFVEAGGLPVTFIDTASGDMTYIHEEKGNEEGGAIRIYSAEGHLEHDGKVTSIKGRGNATWLRSKKPYSLTLHTEVDLLGMGAAQNWILLANAYDKTSLRNKLAQDLAKEAGLAFSPDAQWTQLYLNGTYAGLYLLSERNEIHPQRVDISKNGSFLVSMELQYRLEEQGYPYVTTDSGAAFRIHYSDMDETALRQILQSAENAILSESGVDTVTGETLQELIDLDSWAKKYLLEEIMANYDAGSVSQYFYFDGSDSSGKLYAGPAWDYDNTLGSREWQTQNPQALLAGRPHISSETDSPWYSALYQKAEFSDRVKKLYRTLYRPLLRELMETGIQDYVEEMGTAAERNGFRWNSSGSAEAVVELKDFLTARIAFLDKIWIDESAYYTVQVYNGMGSLGCFAVFPGEPLPQMPEYDPSKYEGWYQNGAQTPFDITTPIYEDMMLSVRPIG